MHCRYAPSGVPDQWSLDDKLLSLIVRGLANFRTNNKSSSEKLSPRRSRTISFLGDEPAFARLQRGRLSVGSFGCGNELLVRRFRRERGDNFLETRIAAQRIPERIESKKCRRNGHWVIKPATICRL